MKTNQFFNMMMVCAALAFSACSSDSILDDNGTVSPETDQEGEVLFTSTVSDAFEVLPTEDLDGEATDGTRSTLVTDNSQFSLTWATSDKISISDGTLNYTFQPKDGEINGASCTFESTTGASFITNGTASSEGTFNAFYPAEAVLGWSGNTVTTMIYTEQKYSENVDNGVMGSYMAARATTTDGGSKAGFTFGHICSVIDVDLSSFDGGTISSVSLLSNSGASVAGRVRYNFETKAAEVVNNDGAGYAASNCISNVVTVSEVGATTAIVRFYVLPVNQANGFTITVRTTDGNFYTKKSTTEVGKSAVNSDYLASMSNQSGSVCLPYYKKYNFNKINNATKNLWMATIPNNLRLRQLTVPGAHNAATSGISSSVSKCQSETIGELLANGVRGFDLRPRYTSSSAITADNLLICHGLTTTNVLFKDAVAALVAFVTANPTETVFINMQKEKTSGTDRSSEWRTAVRTIFGNNSSYLLGSLESYQNFGDARGKIVVISKNPYGNEDVYSDVVYGGIIQDTGDATSTTGAYIYKVGGVKIADASWEDHYNASTSNKKGYVQTMLEAAAGDATTRFYFTWNNIANAPSDYANTMNPWLKDYITGNAPADRLGFIYADFIGSSSYGGAALLKAIIQHNHKYVYKGRSRCTTSSGGADSGVDVATDEYADGTQVFSKKH